MAHIRRYKKGWAGIVDLPREPGQDRNRKWVYGKTEEEVKNKVTELEYQIMTEQFVDESNVTVKAYLEQWFKLHKHNLSPYTRSGYKVNLDRHIIPYLGEIKLKKLTPFQIENLYATLLEKGRTDGKGGLSSTSVLYVHRVLREAITAAVGKLIQKNPMAGVKSPKARRKPVDRVYNEKQVIDFLNRISGHELEIAANLAVCLGMRRGEILALTWNDIDFENKTISINKAAVYSKETGRVDKEPKTETSIRTLEIPDNMIGLLRKHKISYEKNKEFYKNAPGEFHDKGLVVCKQNGDPYNPPSFSHTFERFIGALGLEDTTLHRLRHAYATLQTKFGTPQHIISKNLGHADTKITGNYEHALKDMKRESANKINRRILKKIQKNDNRTT